MLLSPDSPTSSDFSLIESGTLNFVTPRVPTKSDVTILVLANPRAGSQQAARYVTECPRETSKLVMPGAHMRAAKMLIYNVHDKEDKVEYIKMIE